MFGLSPVFARSCLPVINKVKACDFSDIPGEKISFILPIKSPAAPRWVGPEIFTSSRMQSEHSVTRWIAAVRTGDAIAAEQLWSRYFRELMAQARLRMANVAKGAYDEEDAALSTFQVLCQKLHEGQYTGVADRQELWQLMLTVLIRKIGRRVKYQTAAKRTCGHVNQLKRSRSTTSPRPLPKKSRMNATS